MKFLLSQSLDLSLLFLFPLFWKSYFFLLWTLEMNNFNSKSVWIKAFFFIIFFSFLLKFFLIRGRFFFGGFIFWLLLFGSFICWLLLFLFLLRTRLNEEINDFFNNLNGHSQVEGYHVKVKDNHNHVLEKVVNLRSRTNRPLTLLQIEDRLEAQP